MLRVANYQHSSLWNFKTAFLLAWYRIRNSETWSWYQPTVVECQQCNFGYHGIVCLRKNLTIAGQLELTYLFHLWLILETKPLQIQYLFKLSFPMISQTAQKILVIENSWNGDSNCGHGYAMHHYFGNHSFNSILKCSIILPPLEPQPTLTSLRKSIGSE